MTFTFDFRGAAALRPFLRGAHDCSFEITPDGLFLTVPASTRDPYVFFDLVSALSACGHAADFPDAASLAAVVFRVRTNHPGYLETYFAAGEVTIPTPCLCAGDTYEGGDQWESVLCDFSASGSYKGSLHDGFRLDWSGCCRAGDGMLVESVTLYGSAEEAGAAADEGNRGRVPFSPCVMPEPAVAESLPVPGFYVCLYEKRLASAGDGNILSRCDTLEEAKDLCDRSRVYGYRVADENGRLVWAPYTLLQCDLLREGKYVTDYVRTHGFRYGDAPINPGIDCEAGLVSCDRLVCWVLWRLGFIHQPYSQGVVVSAFPRWCERNGFIRLDDCTALEPGDVMLVRPHHTGLPQHAFLFAGYCEKPDTEPNFPAQVADPLAPAGPSVPELFSFRYDCGSDKRIQSLQPSKECLFPGAYTPVCLYRPVATRENCLNYERYC